MRGGVDYEEQPVAPVAPVVLVVSVVFLLLCCINICVCLLFVA